MAIQFVRVEIVGRSNGGNACCKGAYNARSKVKDQKTGEVYNFIHHVDNVYHEVLLPEVANKKYKDVAILLNEVERVERKINSQLIKEVVIALPDDKELNLQDRIEITHRIIDKMEWVKNGLAVQVDIHEPHDGERNWHAHLLVMTRRFTKDGMELGEKARDLNPQFKNGKNGSFIVPEEEMIHEKGRDIINDYFKELGLPNRVDEIGKIAQEHIGPRRMRAALNERVVRNEGIKLSNVNSFKTGMDVINSICRTKSVFNESDVERVLKCIEDEDERNQLFEEAMSSKEILELFEEGVDGKVDGKTDEKLKFSGFYTTKSIRLEEQRLLRLGSYIAKGKSVFSGKEQKAARILRELKSSNEEVIARGEKGFNEEQIEALEYMLSSDSSLKILRGRAGTGKSHVFGELGRICRELGVNIVGLAPTHKARGELEQRGFEQNDTVKGMLFKIKNGKFELPKGSLIVVDEAGMITNADLREFLRVAAGYKCSVIMGGDERQLSSPSRGGMFEVFSEKFTSRIMSEIRRQENEWGREVSSRLSEGDVRGGLNILNDRGKIRYHNNRVESMMSLLKDWNGSAESLNSKIILAVKNSDVDLLNKGARQYLKASGVLTGPEFDIKGKTYCCGDRILIIETAKELGLTNGDFAEIIYASKDKFSVRVRDEGSGENDGGKIIEFDPVNYHGFRHGYATTIFKSQGASIRDVFVYHGGFCGIKNSYVGLSRNIIDLKLYVSKETTRSFEHLVKQMSMDPEISSSLAYKTKEEIEKELARQENLTNANMEKEKSDLFSKIVSQAAGYAKNKFTEITDKYSVDMEYYDYKPEAPSKQHIEEVFELFDIVEEEISEELEGRGEKRLAGNGIDGSKEGHILNGAGHEVAYGKSISDAKKLSNTRGKLPLVPRGVQSAKQRFYSKVDYAKLKEARQAERDEVWSRENEQLKHYVKMRAEDIAANFLGPVNKKMSYGDKLRFGSSGKIVVRVTDGRWHDFSTSEGGDMFKLVQRERGCDFKEAEKYLRDYLAMPRETTRKSSHLETIDNPFNNHRLENKIKAAEQVIRQKEKDNKINKALKLYARSKPLNETAIGFRYLTKTRHIDGSIVSRASDDIRTAGFLIGQTKNANPIYAPALIAFARDERGEITGGQHIVLDKKTAGKAKIDIAKRSFGVVSGSFVEVFNTSSKEQEGLNDKRVTIIAEGLETALSVAQGVSCLFQERKQPVDNQSIRVLCSLGISNIRNYPAKDGEKIIIAADNDGKESKTDASIERAKEFLKENGAFVEVVRPNCEGDFNDVLKNRAFKDIGKFTGSEEISLAFKEAIDKHQAKTVREYFKAIGGEAELTKLLTKQSIEDLGYIEKHQVNQDRIINGFRKSDLRGTIELDNTRRNLMVAQDFISSKGGHGLKIFEELEGFGVKLDKTQIIKALTSKTEEEKLEYLHGIRDEHYIKVKLQEISLEKAQNDNPKKLLAVLVKEQEFYKNLRQNLKSKSIDEHVMSLIEQADLNKQNKIFEQLHKIVGLHLDKGITSPADIAKILKNTEGLHIGPRSAHDSCQDLIKSYQAHIIKGVQMGLDGIHAGKVVNINGKKFGCQIEFLEHVLEVHKDNQFLPRQAIEKTHSQLHECHLDKDFTLGI